MNYRKERIERLLDELKYEITRGMMDGEIEEGLRFEFIIPVSKALPGGVVFCTFRTHPTHMKCIECEPHLKVVE